MYDIICLSNFEDCGESVPSVGPSGSQRLSRQAGNRLEHTLSRDKYRIKQIEQAKLTWRKKTYATTGMMERKISALREQQWDPKHK